MYNDCSIPARLFYEIILKNDVSLLGGEKEDQQEAFDNIFDEYYELKEDFEMQDLMKRKSLISELKLKIQFIKTVMDVILNTPLTDLQRDRLINSLGETGIKFDKEKSIIDECNRINHSVLGGLENRLTLEELSVKKESIAKKVRYEDSLVSIENILGRSIEDNVSLRKYLALEKSANIKNAA